MKTPIIFGLGYGDEGKGTTVAYLAETRKPTYVIRYNGGPQAAHNVHSEIRGKVLHHTFNQFGSGSLSGAKTYYSIKCIFNLVAFADEFTRLTKLGIDATNLFYIHPYCVLNTLAHQIMGRAKEVTLRHGSCGWGLWETISLIQTSFPTMRVIDLLDPDVAMTKYQDQLEYALALIKQMKLSDEDKTMLGLAEIKAEVDAFRFLLRYVKYMRVIGSNDLFESKDTFIFEGAQGFLLSDKFYEHTPHVSISDCGPTHAIQIANHFGMEYELFPVTRCYSTRHGNGPFIHDQKPEVLDTENNVENPWQGNFRTGAFNASLMAWAYKQTVPTGVDVTLSMTCMDKISTWDSFLSIPDFNPHMALAGTRLTDYHQLFENSDPLARVVQMLDSMEIAPQHLLLSDSPMTHSKRLIANLKA